MEIRYATISKTGIRHHNEDAFNVIDMLESNRFMGIVCDGMGSHSFGETVSETVCNTISDFWKKHTSTPDCDSKVKLACKKASCAIDKKAFELHHAEMVWHHDPYIQSDDKDLVFIPVRTGDLNLYSVTWEDGSKHQRAYKNGLLAYKQESSTFTHKD